MQPMTGSKSETKSRKTGWSQIEVRDARTDGLICRLRANLAKSIDLERCAKCGGLLNFDDVRPPLPEWAVEQVGCSCD